MKRVMFPALVVLYLLFMPVKEQSFAEETIPPLDLSALQWKLLQPTVTKTDLGSNLPEVVVLTLSNDQFTKISGDKSAAMKYLTDQKIFKRKLLNVEFCAVTANVDGTGQWILIIPHTFQSTAYIVAWQIPTKGGSS